MTAPLHRRLRILLAAALSLSAGATLSAQDAATAIPIANPGFEEGQPGGGPPGWHGTIAAAAASASQPAAYRAANDPDNARAGKASVRLEAPAQPGGAPFGVVTSSVDASAYRGKRVRFTAAVRVREEAGTRVGLWMRVDRAEKRPGFFDNMDDRPIRSGRWADYVIEGDVAADAEKIFFGLLLAGPGAAWMDEVRLEIVGPARSQGMGQIGPQRPRTAPAAGDVAPRALTARGLANLEAFARLYGYVRWFHPSDEAAAADWDRIAMAGVERVEEARTPAELAAALDAVFQPVAPTVDAFAAGSSPAALPPRPAPEANGLRWRHTGMGEDPGGLYKSLREEVEEIAPSDVASVDLGGGVSARVPLAVWRVPGGKSLPAAGRSAIAPAKPAGFVPSGFDRTTRIASVVVGWNLFQHFYPYFDVVEADWPAQLRASLKAAATDSDDLAFHRTLRRLVAALDDGHGNVRYASDSTGTLPIAWEMVEGKLVVTAAGAGSGIRRGEIVTHVGGLPLARALAAMAGLQSGSPQWVRWRALQEMRLGRPGEAVELRVQDLDGRARTVKLAYDDGPAAQGMAERKPEPVAELEPGILYVDLDRVSEEAFRAKEKDLAAAKGLIFDLRGYPRGSPWYLPHLSDRPVRSAVFARPVYLRPNRQGATFDDGGWNMPPQTPRFTANTVFVTDGRAISYAESVAGVIKGNGLAEIVGEPTAGANGNVSFFNLPGGYRVAWTAMRVTNRDGSQHHLLGVRPTIPASRSLAGVRAGRDELLEKALGVVRSRLPK